MGAPFFKQGLEGSGLSRVNARSGAEGLTVLLLLGFLLLAGCAPGNGWEAIWVLADMAAGSGPSRLKKMVPAPLRREIVFSIGTRSYRGDLYRPAQGAVSALLLIPGAAEEGKDDPRLVAFATTLSRARFTVLVPDIPSLRELQVNPGNIREVADAFAWLVAQRALAPGGRGGMVAFSYAAGPAIIAALETDLRQRVDFIFAVGGYHDLERVLVFFTTGWFRLDGKWRYLEPNDYGKWIFLASNLDRVAAGDRKIFRAMAERKKADLQAEVADLAEGLTAGGLRLFSFLTNRDRQRAPELLRRLPQGVLDDVASLDLANKDLSTLDAELILVHGYDDSIIPYAESISLAAAAGEGRAQVFLVEGLAHVDLEPGLWSRVRLWRAVHALLIARDSPRRTRRSSPRRNAGLLYNGNKRGMRDRRWRIAGQGFRGSTSAFARNSAAA